MKFRKEHLEYAVTFLVIFLILGLAESPLVSPPPSGLAFGNCVFTVSIPLGSQTLNTVGLVSLSVASPDLILTPETNTPYPTTMLFSFGLTEHNLSSIFTVSEATISLDNTNVSSVPVTFSVDKQGDWSGSINEGVVFLGAGSVTGNLAFTVLLKNGTRINRVSPLSFIGIYVEYSNPILRTLYHWGLSLALWGIGAIGFIALDTRKPSKRKH